MLLITIPLTLLIYIFPWNKFHYGDEKKIVKHDTIVIVKNTNPAVKLDIQNKQVTKDRPVVDLPKKSLNQKMAKKPDTIYKAKNMVTAPNYGNQQVGDGNTMIIPDKFKPASDLIKTKVNTNLQLLVNSYSSHPIVNIMIEYDSKRAKAATELSNILSPYRIGYYDPSNMIQNGFSDPVRICANSNNKKFVNDFIIAISPFFTADFLFSYNDNYPISQVLLKIGGEPSYDKNGKIIIN